MIKSGDVLIKYDGEEVISRIRFVPSWLEDLLVGDKVGQKLTLHFCDSDDVDTFIDKLNESDIWTPVLVGNGPVKDGLYYYHIPGTPNSMIGGSLEENVITITRVHPSTVISKLTKQNIISNQACRDIRGLYRFKKYRTRLKQLLAEGVE